MTLDEFNNAGLGLEVEIDVKDDDGFENTIKYWIEPIRVEGDEVKAVHVCTDWAIEFSFNIMDNDTPGSILKMAEACIEDAYNDED
ncbi:hypothetical protein moha_123 [Escherichia phage moha]|uniref:Phage protein n=1 Tax=Escherichia phage moha TaxID=2696423 RepID=A0A6B9WU77_9CAUD|nr:hypothetical protein moha_123 [Escherichia phage moha]